METGENFLFEQIIQNIYNNEDNIIKCKIIKERIDKNSNIKFLDIFWNKEIKNSFIRKVENNDNKNLENKTISFKIKDLKIQILAGIPYFNINCFTVLDDAGNFQDSTNVKIYDTVQEINKNFNGLCCFKLKAKEIFKDVLLRSEFIFEDLSGKIVELDKDLINNFDFENEKIYIFNAFLYDETNNLLKKTLISSIEKYSSLHEKIYELDQINNIKNDNLLNFKANIISFNISKTNLKVKDEKGNEYNVKVNYKLLKKISLNAKCIFLNFKKSGYKTFINTNFSDIESKEETFIEFNLIEGETLSDSFYNIIKINETEYKINENKFKIRINDKNKDNIFVQEISYQKIINKKIIESFDFSVEINKGKNNIIHTSFDKGGFCYQLYIKSINSQKLPKEIYITMNNKSIKIKNADNNFSKFQKRFILINIQKQNIKNMLNAKKLNYSNEKDSRNKYLILIKNEDEISLKIFHIKNLKEKKIFEVSDEISKEMEKLYNSFIDKSLYIVNKYKNKKYLFPELETEKAKLNAIFALFPVILNGFIDYEFENSKKDYNNIKYLSFIFLYHYINEAKNELSCFLLNYNELLKYIIDLEYIDRIKVLITFVNNYYHNIFQKEIIQDKNNTLKIRRIGPTLEELIFINLDKKESIEKYPYIEKAFNLLYNLIDKLTEDSALFRIIQQLNSLIYEEEECKNNKDTISGINNKLIHSGSILNVDDIKLELIQNINRFIFLSLKDENKLESYAVFNDMGSSVIIYLKSFFNINKEITEQFISNMEIVVLFLLFHECLGHQKKSINNEDISTPRKHYGIYYEEITTDYEDTGIFLEIVLFGKPFNPILIIENKNCHFFLNQEIYLQKNFDELHKLYSDLENSSIKNGYLKSNKNDKTRENISFLSYASQKFLDNKNIIKEEETENEKEEEKVEKKKNLLFHDLFAKFFNMTEKEKKKNQNNEEFQRFLFYFNKKKNRTVYTPEFFIK